MQNAPQRAPTSGDESTNVDAARRIALAHSRAAAQRRQPRAEALPIATAVSFACGALYPWNAKFGYISPGLPVKYPMHYVPEILMVALTVLGIKAMM